MGILDSFDLAHDGWSFHNWTETTDFSWDLYRRTYLAINPTNDVVAAPLDVAFYKIFKNCAKHGNCGGMSMLALALFKYGGFMGFCSPPDIYPPADPTSHEQPASHELYQAINIMQGRQFSAPGIQNFVDMVKAGQLNDGVAAWQRVKSGLDSGDYCMVSLATGLFGDNAHTLLPYQADMVGSQYVIHVWDCDRPYPWFTDHYTNGFNRIIIDGPSSWTYDQSDGGRGGEYSDGIVYKGSDNGWLFAIPTSLELHKAHQPISAGFDLTNALNLVFASGPGAAVTQIRDEDGRRLYTSDRVHRHRSDLETSPDRQLHGVAPWPWPSAGHGPPPGELFFMQRPPGSTPLHISVQGSEYTLTHASSGHLTELTAGPAATTAKDRVRIQASPSDDQSLEVTTSAGRRRFNIHHLRYHGPAWRSATVDGAAIGAEHHMSVHAPMAFDHVEISGPAAIHPVNVVFRRYDGDQLTTRRLPKQRASRGDSLRLAPDWERLSRAKVMGAKP